MATTGRYEGPSQALGQDLFEKVRQSRVLVVGAGNELNNNT